MMTRFRMNNMIKFLRITIVFTVVCLSQTTFAQHARFVESGVITYQKRVNMYAKIKARVTDGNNFMQQAYEQYRKTQPQFNEYNYTLSFGNNQSLFKPEGRSTNTGGFFGTDPTIDMGNVVHSNLDNRQSISQKSIYEETFLVTDSIRHIDWKLTDEVREIAGYHCRRANALVLDSIYVVAFYTDQIPVTGGPESFAGLPGMILGLALPYENTTWFATKVEDKSLREADLTAPQKGRAVDRTGLLSTIQSSLKNWGSHADQIIKALML